MKRVRVRELGLFVIMAIWLVACGGGDSDSKGVGIPTKFGKCRETYSLEYCQENYGGK